LCSLQVDRASQRQSSEEDDDEGGRWSGKRIIIADDIPQLRQLYSSILGLQGYRVLLTAGSGEEVIDLARLGKLRNVDMALLDYSMGSVSGLDAGLEATKYNPQLRIVIDSANDEIKDRVESSGFSFIKKPFQQAELLDLLGSIESDIRKSS
jgi:DNA-binding NtrC family response regulator